MSTVTRLLGLTRACDCNRDCDCDCGRALSPMQGAARAGTGSQDTAPRAWPPRSVRADARAPGLAQPHPSSHHLKVHWHARAAAFSFWGVAPCSQTSRTAGPRTPRRRWRPGSRPTRRGCCTSATGTVYRSPPPIVVLLSSHCAWSPMVSELIPHTASDAACPPLTTIRFPVPFSVPARPYGEHDVPWTWGTTHREKDSQEEWCPVFGER